MRLRHVPPICARAAAEGSSTGCATELTALAGTAEAATRVELEGIEVGLKLAPQDSQNNDPSVRALPQAEQFTAIASVPHDEAPRGNT